MKKKRAAGGGRKAQDGPTSPLTFRIPDDMRKQLESEASAKGGSVAERLIWHLRQSLSSQREHQRDKAMRALCFLIGEIAHQVVGHHEFIEETKSERPLHSWRSDPFFYRAFKLAVSQMLDTLEPKGEIKAPDIRLSLTAQPGFEQRDADSFVSQYLQSWKSPEARANYAAGYVLNSFTSIPSYSMEEREQERRRLESIGVPSWLREFYGMPDAARDLTIKARDKGGKSR